jgi:hypothetical protein
MSAPTRESFKRKCPRRGDARQSYGTPSHVGITLALGRLIAEVPPSIDHLLGRASADAELQAPACDEIGRACILAL